MFIIYDAYDKITGGGLPLNLTFIRNCTGSCGDTSDLDVIVDADFKLVVVAATKSDGNPTAWNDDGMKILSGEGTKLRAVVYRTNSNSTGCCAVFTNVTKGTKIHSGWVGYGSGTIVAMCFN